MLVFSFVVVVGVVWANTVKSRWRSVFRIRFRFLRKFKPDLPDCAHLRSEATLAELGRVFYVVTTKLLAFHKRLFIIDCSCFSGRTLAMILWISSIYYALSVADGWRAYRNHETIENPMAPNEISSVSRRTMPCTICLEYRKLSPRWFGKRRSLTFSKSVEIVCCVRRSILWTSCRMLLTTRCRRETVCFPWSCFCGSLNDSSRPAFDAYRWHLPSFVVIASHYDRHDAKTKLFDYSSLFDWNTRTVKISICRHQYSMVPPDLSCCRSCGTLLKSGL